eukprot:4770825-Heterocapsa_arctica.AAC.1
MLGENLVVVLSRHLHADARLATTPLFTKKRCPLVVLELAAPLQLEHIAHALLHLLQRVVRSSDE